MPVAKAKAIVVAWLLLACSGLTLAEEVRDYYSEPGLHPFKEMGGQDQTENIDPFSGTLQLQYTDLLIPGNGGMDIAVRRSYTNPQKNSGYYSVFGIGWQVSFGRVVVPAQNLGTMCNIANNGNTEKNPSVEHPDGARELLVYNDISNDGGDGSLITKSNWLARCITPNDHTDGVLVTAPDGTRYRMTVISTIYNSEGVLVETNFLPSDIEDVYGNWIAFEYGNLPNRGTSAQKYLTRITAGTSSAQGGGVRSADGREVTFAYIDQNDQPLGPSSRDARLSQITAHYTGILNQVWQYRYEQADMAVELENFYGLKSYQLTEVVRPDNTTWRYTYYPEIIGVDDADSLALHSVTYPAGGTITYDYQGVHFYTWTQSSSLKTRSIYTKTTSGLNGGTWRYEFAPGSYSMPGHPNPADVTTIYRPDGARELHYHYGHTYSLNYYDLLWLVGLKFRQDTFNASNQRVETTLQNWGKRRLSAQFYLQKIASSSGADRATWAPILTYQFSSRYDGDEIGTTLTYANHDKFGNPGQTTAMSSVSAYPDKVTDLTYFNDESKWIIGKADTESVSGVSGDVDRTFNSFGSVVSEVRYGVATSQTYSVDGDLASSTDANGNTTYFDNYYRGIPLLERKPVDNIRTVRTVNPSGTVATFNITSDSDTRNLTKAFTYDNLNRLNGIQFRLGDPMSITWSGAQNQTLVRGRYQQQTHFDGFGRQRQSIRKDMSTGEEIITTADFDALGRKVFESNPNSSEGIQYSYTALNDIERIDYANGDFRQYTYINANRWTVTDGNGHTTIYLDSFFGLPDMDRKTHEIETTEYVTQLFYNSLNQLTRFFQGRVAEGGGLVGRQRQFVYDSRTFLSEESHPDLGGVLYTRDDAGNIKTKTAGGALVESYQYDNINRLTKIDYNSFSTTDKTITYTKTDKVKTISSLNYDHDDNDNLIRERFTFSGRSVSYSINSLDAVSAITYPSGRSVELAPDAFGRPRQVGDYVSAVDYHPAGQPRQITYANGLQTQTDVDPDRLWIDRIRTHSPGTIIDLDYSYDMVGNVSSIIDNVNPAQNRALTYDSIDRLVTAQGDWGNESYSYDFGNNVLTQRNILYGYESAGSLLTNIRIVSTGWRVTFGRDALARTRTEYETGVATPTGEGYRNSYSYSTGGNLISVEQLFDKVSQDYVNFGYDGADHLESRYSTKENKSTYYMYTKNGLLLGVYPEFEPYDRPDLSAGKEFFYLGNQLVASAGENLPPTAVAGSDQSVSGGAAVTLSGVTSHDPDGVINQWRWEQIAGTPTVSLIGGNSSAANFTAPAILGSRQLRFRLTVTDDSGDVASDEITVDTQFSAPDSDGDGIHDSWETAYGLNPNDPGDASGDTDGDGINNLNEYLMGTYPGGSSASSATNNDIPFLPPWALVLMAAALYRLRSWLAASTGRH